MDNIVFIIDVTDKRNQYLMQALQQDGYIVEEFIINRKCYDALKMYVYVFAPATVLDNDIAEDIPSGSMIFCLNCESKLCKYFWKKDIKVIKFFDDEILAMQNAYLTAEGTLALIIDNTLESIKNSNILVLGYGRLGKTITKLLKDNNVNVYVATNPTDEQAQATVVANYVCDIKSCKKHMPYFSAIVNTIPAKVLCREELALVNKNCLIVDLASKPGGVDHKAACELNIKTLHALGVPGKTAPKTAAENLRGSIYKIIYESKQKGNYE